MLNPHAPLDRDIMSAYGNISGDPDFFNSDMGGPANMWHQDRATMAAGHWTGIRVISFAYPKGMDWRSIDAFNPSALAAE